MAIPKPTEEEMNRALEMAEAMRDQGRDEYYMAHALLYLKERNKLLEDLYKKADYYLRFGMPEKELSDLRLALRKMHEQDVDDADESLFFSRE